MLISKHIADGINIPEASKQKVYHQLSIKLTGKDVSFDFIKNKVADYDVLISDNKLDRKDIDEYTIVYLLQNVYVEDNLDQYLATLIFAQATDATFNDKEYAKKWFSSIEKLKDAAILLHQEGFERHALALDLWELEYLIENNSIEIARKKYEIIKDTHPELFLLNRAEMTLEEYGEDILMQTLFRQDNKLYLP